MEIEIWKDIPNYEGYYQVSSLGRIKSLSRVNSINKKVPEKILKPHKNKQNRYYTVNLYKNDKAKTFYVHRLVALTFIPNPNNFPQVGHKDESRDNNCVDNLEWVTNKENSNTPLRKNRLKNASAGRPCALEKKIKHKKATEQWRGRKFWCEGKIWNSATDLSNYLHLPLSTFLNYANGRCNNPPSLPMFMELTQKEKEN